MVSGATLGDAGMAFETPAPVRGAIRSGLRLAGALAVAGALAACQSVGPLEEPTRDFVAAANALAVAEADYFDQIQAASDAGHRLRAVSTFAAGPAAAAPGVDARTFAGFKTEFLKRDDFSKAKAVRLNAIAQLQNYAQAVSEIQGGGQATWVSEQTGAVIANANGLAQTAGLSGLDQKAAGLAQKIVATLGQAILDHASAKKLQELAVAAREPIGQLEQMVAEDQANLENNSYVASLGTDQRDEMLNALHVVFDDPRVNAAERFGVALVVTKARAIHASMAKLKAANEAMAEGQKLTAKALFRQAEDLADLAASAGGGK
jgi:predicted small lipoprotein YifL